MRLRPAFQLCLVVLCCLIPALPQTHAHPKPPGPPQAKSQVGKKPVSLTPEFVQSGSPELIRVESPDASSIEGEWLGHPVLFFPGVDHRAWYALAGVDVETSPGSTSLKISVHLNSEVQNVSVPVEIHSAHYRTGSLTVSPKFVEPGPDALKQINIESELKKKVFAISVDRPLWMGYFHAPVNSPPTGSFGTRRMFNGKLASIHKGMDFRAPSGTPVLAGNAGKVILAQPLYYEGNCVILDHGLGLMSLSMHLSRIDVKVGETVDKGQRLGLSGATGRVTGPHLHWAIRWQGAMLDPAKLLRLDLNNLR